MTTFKLTTGIDTLVVGQNDTVNGTATLNSGDSLTGGGNDTLALYGSGTFPVDQLANFTGFANITLNNFTNGSASLVLGSQAIAVTGYGSGSESLTLGSGAVTFQGGSGFTYSAIRHQIGTPQMRSMAAAQRNTTEPRCIWIGAIR
jgi:hypothetical protein